MEILKGDRFGKISIRKNTYLYVPLNNKKVILKALELLPNKSIKRKIFNCVIKKIICIKSLRTMIFEEVVDIKLENELVESFEKLHDYFTFSVYTGTPGRYNKLTIQLIDNKGNDIAYVKVPIKESAIISVKNEANKLNDLISFEFSNLVIPKIIKYNEKMLIQTSNKEFIYDIKELNKNIFNALLEIYNKTKGQRKLVSDCGEFINKLNYIVSEKVLDLEIREIIMDYVSKNQVVYTIAHCDFTSWNIKQNIESNKIYVFDWEFATEQIYGYDIFHYIFMESILINKLTIHDIIESILNNKYINEFTSSINLCDSKSLFIIYLINIIEFYYIADKVDNKPIEDDFVLQKAIHVLNKMIKEKK